MNNRINFIFPLLCISGLVVSCNKLLKPVEFIQVYEEMGQLTVVRNGYIISIMFQSPEYIALKSLGNQVSKEAFTTESDKYRNASYFSLNIIPQEFSGNIQNVFKNKMGILQNQMGRHVYLQSSKGHIVYPLTYNYSRSFESGSGNHFLFLFPKKMESEHLILNDYFLVIEDVGINIGTLKSKIIIPDIKVQLS